MWYAVCLYVSCTVYFNNVWSISGTVIRHGVQKFRTLIYANSARFGNNNEMSLNMCVTNKRAYLYSPALIHSLSHLFFHQIIIYISKQSLSFYHIKTKWNDESKLHISNSEFRIQKSNTFAAINKNHFTFKIVYVFVQCAHIWHSAF